MKGLIVKDYQIIDAIGEGGMATVYLGEHQMLGHKVAIKILHEELVKNKNIRNRFIAEAKNMARMSHQNIIKVTDLVDAGDLVAFVMEYIEGLTLKEYLDTNGKLSDDEIKKLFVEMLDAVGYVHQQGLVHRDIKPSNFILSVTGVVKLLDFGIAKNTDTSSSEYTMTGTTQNMGTPMYMSPEQVKSSKDVTLKTDIYSLGVVLWQMVSGRRPYDSGTLSNFEIQLKIFQEQLPILNSSWDAIIQKATAKNELDRFEDSKTIKLIITESKEITNSINTDQSVNSFQKNNDTINDESTIFQEINSSNSIKGQSDNKLSDSSIVLYEASVFGGPDTTSNTSCPSCHWKPDAKKRWVCSCGYQWDTFSTRGRCPKCNIVHAQTQCPKCEVLYDHSDWYIFKKLKYGFVDIAGNWVIEPKFDYVSGFVGDDDYCQVTQNGKRGFIKRNGRYKIQPKFDDLHFFQEDGTANARVKNKWGIIDRKGNWVINPNYEDVYYFDKLGFCRASQKNQYGFIDKAGEWKVQPKFDDLGYEFDKLGYTKACKNEKWGFIRMNGEWKIQPIFNEIRNSFDDHGNCIVSVGQKWGVIDRNGSWTVQPVFDELGDYDDKDYCRASVKGKYGFINRQGSWIIDPKFDSLSVFGSDNCCSATIGEKNTKINRAGNYLFQPVYDDLGFEFDEHGYCSACIDGKWGSIDMNGNWLISATYDDEYFFDELGYASVAIDQKWGWIDRKGNWLIQPMFDGVDRWDNFGFSLVYIDGRTGLINREGRYQISPVFFLLEKVGDPAARHKNELYFKASQNNYYGIIDIHGNWIIDPKFDYYYVNPLDYYFSEKHIWNPALQQWELPETGSSFNIDKESIIKYFSHLKGSSKIYLIGDEMPVKKIHNFSNDFNKELFVGSKIYLYYDDTLFGKGDNGFVILNDNDRFYLFLSPYLGDKIGICFTDDGVNNYLRKARFSKINGIELIVQTQADESVTHLIGIKNEVASILVDFLNKEVL